MKISSFATLYLAATAAQPTSAFFDFLFGGGAAEEGSSTGTGGEGVFYLKERADSCFVKVDGSPSLKGDYGVNNPKINPGLVCIGAVCNTGHVQGALGITMSQGDDNDEKTTFSDEIKVECPGTDRFEFQFSCPAYEEAISIESITCLDGDTACNPRTRISGGSIEIDDDGNNDQSLVTVVFKCTSP